ncbi:hypothetical protein BCV69DRAFT_282900 [Microstroma glucosiphilum]|uniref:Uncharacterized protein n=1 Tax=Pseudomicrostroma glucosiphilum TaxID=1684307 RepID=A0A316U885_9BASI|nr:hypothetical protein BCV69DRAFT_282900 [Pseudomicrostroma glucosiphilum]PWN20681.1 hypothetical protein BCV69DRAFT_282900 [Pseudomicrostroma glucosiphilum]
MTSSEAPATRPLPLGSRSINTLPKSGSLLLDKLRSKEILPFLPPTPPRTQSPNDTSSRTTHTSVRRQSPPSPSPQKSMSSSSHLPMSGPSTPARGLDPKRNRPMLSPALSVDGISPNPRERKRLDERLTPAKERLGSIEEVQNDRSARRGNALAQKTALAERHLDSNASDSECDESDGETYNNIQRQRISSQQAIRSSPANSTAVADVRRKATTSRARQAALDRELLNASQSISNASTPSSFDLSHSLSQGSDSSISRRSKRVATKTVHGKGVWPALAPVAVDSSKQGAAKSQSARKAAVASSSRHNANQELEQSASQPDRTASSLKSIRKAKASHEAERPRVSFSQPLPTTKVPAFGDPRPPGNRRRATSSQPVRTPTKTFASAAEKRAFFSTIKRLPPLKPEEKLSPFVPAPASPGEDPILLKGHPDEYEPEWVREYDEGEENDTFAAVKTRHKASDDNPSRVETQQGEDVRRAEGDTQDGSAPRQDQADLQVDPEADLSDFSRQAQELHHVISSVQDDPFAIGYGQYDNIDVFDAGVSHSYSDDDNDYNAAHVSDVEEEASGLAAQKEVLSHEQSQAQVAASDDEDQGLAETSQEVEFDSQDTAVEDVERQSSAVPAFATDEKSKTIGAEVMEAYDLEEAAEPVDECVDSGAGNDSAEEEAAGELSFFVEQRELRREEDEEAEGDMSVSYEEPARAQEEGDQQAQEEETTYDEDEVDASLAALAPAAVHPDSEAEEEADLEASLQALDVNASSSQGKVEAVEAAPKEAAAAEAAVENDIQPAPQEGMADLTRPRGTQLAAHNLDTAQQSQSGYPHSSVDHSYLHSNSSRSIMHSMARPTSIVEVMSTDAEAAARAAAILRVHHKWIHEGHVVTDEDEGAEATFVGSVLASDANATTMGNEGLLPGLLSQAESELQKSQKAATSVVRDSTPRAKVPQLAATPAAPGAWSFSPAISVTPAAAKESLQVPQTLQSGGHVDVRALLEENAGAFPRQAWRALDKVFRRTVRHMAASDNYGSGDLQPTLLGQRRAARAVEQSAVVDAFIAAHNIEKSMLRKRWSYTNLSRSVQALQRHWFVRLEADYPGCLTAEEAAIAERPINYSDGNSTSSITRQSSPALSQFLRDQSSVGDVSPMTSVRGSSRLSNVFADIATHSTPLQAGRRGWTHSLSPAPSPIASQASPLHEQRLDDPLSEVEDDTEEAEQEVPLVPGPLDTSRADSPEEASLIQRTSAVFTRRLSTLFGQPIEGLRKLVGTASVNGDREEQEAEETSARHAAPGSPTPSLYPALPEADFLPPPVPPPEPTQEDLSVASRSSLTSRANTPCQASAERAAVADESAATDATSNEDDSSNVSSSSASLAQEAATAAMAMAEKRQLKSMSAYSRSWVKDTNDKINSDARRAPPASPTRRTMTMTMLRNVEHTPPSKRASQQVQTAVVSPKGRSSLSNGVRATVNKLNASASTITPGSSLAAPTRFPARSNPSTFSSSSSSSSSSSNHRMGCSSFVRPTVLAGLTQDAHEAARAQAASMSASRGGREWMSPLKKKKKQEALQREQEREKQREVLKLRRSGAQVVLVEADKENSLDASSFDLSLSMSRSRDEGSFESKRDLWTQRSLIASAGSRKSFTRL